MFHLEIPGWLFGIDLMLVLLQGKNYNNISQFASSSPNSALTLKEWEAMFLNTHI